MIPSANTNLPTIMVAERISSWLRQGWAPPPGRRDGQAPATDRLYRL